MLLAAFADATGTGMFLPLSVAFLTRVVGLSATHIGLGLGIAGAVAVPTTAAAGGLIERFGPRPVVLGCCALNAAGFIAYLAVSSFAAFLAVAVAVQVATRIERPATASLVLATVPKTRRVGALARQQAFRNVGYGIGGIGAGLVLAIGGRGAFDAALALNAASYLMAAAVVSGVVLAGNASAGGTSLRGGYRPVLADRPFVRIVGLNTLVALHDSLLRVGMPLWIITRTNAPAAVTGLLFALNTILVATLQVRTSRRIEQRHGIDRSYRRAAAAFVLCGALFALSAGAPLVLALIAMTCALIALTVAELENTAEEAYVSVVSAPGELRPRYISLFKTSMSLQQAAGPAIVALALSKLGQSGFVLLGVVAAAGALASRAALAAASGPKPRAPKPPYRSRAEIDLDVHRRRHR